MTQYANTWEWCSSYQDLLELCCFFSVCVCVCVCLITESYTEPFKLSIISCFLLFVKIDPICAHECASQQWFTDTWAPVLWCTYQFTFQCLEVSPNPSSKAIRGAQTVLINDESLPHGAVSAWKHHQIFISWMDRWLDRWMDERKLPISEHL